MNDHPSVRHAVDLRFLRILSGSPMPRRVPVGPAFDLVLAYQAAGYVVLQIPAQLRTPSGRVMQPDAVVLGLTSAGGLAVAEAAERSLAEQRATAGLANALRTAAQT